MNRIPTIIELFAHNDWANDQLFETTAGFSDKALDRHVEMGIGALRATLKHIVDADEIWLERIQQGPEARPWVKPEKTPIAQLRHRAHDLAGRRNQYLAQLEDAVLDRVHNYRDSHGDPYRSGLLDIFLHVANHGQYHRAQAMNMIRHSGEAPEKLPRVDYIAMQLNRMPPALSQEVIAYYLKCSDWMHRVMLDACEGLSDEQLDRPFEMGIGTIRKTISHTQDSGTFWLKHWKDGPTGGFPKPDAKSSIAALRSQFDETARQRDAYLASLKSEKDWSRPIEVRPAPDKMFQFPLAVTATQICLHGTYHRAQISNMMRHVGKKPPGNDLILMTR